jgi:hypothetical protein
VIGRRRPRHETVRVLASQVPGKVSQHPDAILSRSRT